MITKLRKAALVALTAAGIWAAAAPAGAIWLYWGYLNVETRELCFARLAAAAHDVGLENVEATPDNQVSGAMHGNRTYAVMTCAPNGAYTWAIIMVAAEEEANAVTLRDALRDHVAAAGAQDGK